MKNSIKDRFYKHGPCGKILYWSYSIPLMVIGGGLIAIGLVPTILGAWIMLPSMGFEGSEPDCCYDDRDFAESERNPTT